MKSTRTTRRSARRHWVAGIVVAGCAAAVASVASASSGNTVKTLQAQLAPYTSTPRSIGPGWTALKKKPPRGRVVAYLGTGESSNAIVQNTMSALAAKAGWTYKFVSYNAAQPGSFDQAITTALNEGANYLAEAGSPLTPAEVSAAAGHHAHWLLDAVYSGAGLTALGAPAPGSSVIDSSDGYAQDHLMGKLVADEFIISSKGRGAAVEEALPEYPILTTFASGFQSQVHKYCPACKIAAADVSIADLLAGNLTKDVVAAVQRNSGYHYLVFDDGPFADAFPNALTSAGMNGIKILGEAGDTTGINGVKAGTELAWTGYSVPMPAWEMMDAAFRNAEGMAVPKADQTQPTQLITKANVGKVPVSVAAQGYNAPAKGLKQFEALWHLG
jgi:hypothetical protein